MFLKSLGVAVGAAVIAPSRLARAEPKKVAIKLEKVEKLREVGGSMTVSVKDRQVLLVRDSETSVRAFDPRCTHQQCAVGYDAAAKKLVCPCHSATYDLDGKVLGGPAPKPLQAFPATLSEDRVVLTFDE
jgi:Rieske Fe-S protein